MKKGVLILLIVLTSCASVNRSLPDNKQELTQHASPIKIFGIGRYAANSMILTLIDSKDQYFTIEAPIDTSLKIGSVYPANTH